QYDANGNPINSGNVIGPNNQLLADANWNYSYDNEGNLIAKTARDGSGISWTYGYDNANQLVSAVHRDGSGNIIAAEAIKYDALGNRIEVDTYTAASGTTTVQKFAHDGTNVYADLDGTGTITAIYVWGQGADRLLAMVSSANGVSFDLTDHLGSV